MQQLADLLKEQPFGRIETFRQKIVPKPRPISEAQRADYSKRLVGFIQKPKIDLGEATEVSAEVMWEIPINASQEAVKSASKAQMDYTWAIYCSVYGLTPQQAMMDYFVLSPEQMEAKFLEAMTRMGQLNEECLNKDIEIERMTAEIGKLKSDVATAGVELGKARAEVTWLKAEIQKLQAQPGATGLEHDPEVPQTQIVSTDAEELRQKLQDALMLFAHGHTDPTTTRRYAGYPIREALYFIAEHTLLVGEDGRPIKQ